MNQIERLIELNEDHLTANNFAHDLRCPAKGMHAQAVESRVNVECWNVQLVINEPDFCGRCGKEIPDGEARYIADTLMCAPCNHRVVNAQRGGVS
jgi:DNA-directed RNA polymerase subunit RPC12/RpoP